MYNIGSVMNGVMPTVFRYKLEIRSIGWKETVDYLTTIYSAYTSIIITYLMYICADYIYFYRIDVYIRQ